ncbi:MAG TPA: hypothetical protein DIC60_02985 [Lachnospiraceae bacterium]|nr:hypothetical protein [Lachnospiraceae bacterium]
MDEIEFRNFLNKTGFDVAYSHFPDNRTPPFICFTQSKQTEGADNKNLLMWFDYNVELYTEKKDIAAEKKIEYLLNTAGIDFTAETVWIEESGIFVTYYNVRLYKKIGGNV